MDRQSLREFRRMEKDMVCTEKAYIEDLMQAMDQKEAVDLAALEARQRRFERAIEAFKSATSWEEKNV